MSAIALWRIWSTSPRLRNAVQALDSRSCQAPPPVCSPPPMFGPAPQARLRFGKPTSRCTRLARRSPWGCSKIWIASHAAFWATPAHPQARPALAAPTMAKRSHHPKRVTQADQEIGRQVRALRIASGFISAFRTRPRGAAFRPLSWRRQTRKRNRAVMAGERCTLSHLGGRSHAKGKAPALGRATSLGRALGVRWYGQQKVNTPQCCA